MQYLQLICCVSKTGLQAKILAIFFYYSRPKNK